MPMPQHVQRWALLACLTLGFAVLESTAHAQAWVGYKGSLDADFDYNLAISNKVLGSGDIEFKDGGSTSHQVTLGAEYVPIDKLAVTVSLPFVMLKYTGNKTAYAHPGGGEYDDGDLHATLTDLRAQVRYQLLDGVVALAPHVGFTIPVADYETVGNTVAGRHLKALHLGLSVGRVVSEETPLYLMARYEFSLVEKYDRNAATEKYGQNRSDVSFIVGYKLLEGKLDLNAAVNFRKTHGGLDFADFARWTPDENMFHDPILAEQILLIGGGVGYQLTDKLAASASAGIFVSGENTQNANVFAFGLSWSVL
jgi:hypothetical protein